jgi:hypothetical protein
MDAHEKKILRQRENNIEDELRRIYENEAGELPNLSSLDTPSSSWRKTGLLIAGVFLFLTALVWVGFFVFGGITFTNQNDYVHIEVIANSVSANSEESSPLTAGVPTRILVRYENRTKTPIASLSMRVNLPTSFTIEKLVPEPTNPGNTWLIGNLAAKSDGIIEIFGTLAGAVPSVEKIQVIASYRPANFSSEFDSIVVEELPIANSAVALKFDATDKATPGEDVSFAYELTNTTSDAVKDLQIKVAAPAGFRASKSEPKIGDGLVWHLPRLEAHSKTSFSLTGTFSADTKGVIDVGGEAYLASGEKKFLQTSAMRAMNVFGGAISANLIVNGSARDQNVSSDSLLSISIPYENGSEIDVKDVEINLEVKAETGSPIDWESEALNLNGGQRNGNKILWNSSTNTSLATLQPSDAGTIDLVLPLASNKKVDRFSLDATVSAMLITGTTKRQTLPITPIVISINSDVSIYSSVLYHSTDGTIIGSGPLPPKVGETTAYVITWTIQNNLHSLKNVTCEAELSKDTTFVNSTHVSDGSLTYNESQHKVRWEVSNMESGGSAQFTVSVKPSQADAGSFLKLSNPVSVVATDSVTEGSIKIDGETYNPTAR